jgi:hypothetical protein
LNQCDALSALAEQAGLAIAPPETERTLLIGRADFALRGLERRDHRTSSTA